MSKKSIVEEALLQASQLEEAMNKNSKGILSSIMKEEIDELVNESLEEMDKEEEMVEGDSKDEKSEEDTEETSVEEQADDEDETDDNESDEDMDDVDDIDVDDLASDEEDGEFADPEIDMDFDDEDLPDFGGGDDVPDLDMDDEMAGLEDTVDDIIDGTGMSDDEVIRVFKKLQPEDGIVVTQDDDGDIDFKDGDNEYHIELNESEEEVDEANMEMEEGEDNEEMMYEIEFDTEDDNEEEGEDQEDQSDEEVKEGDNPEQDMEEASRTFATHARKPASRGKKFKSGRNQQVSESKVKTKKMINEYRQLKDDNKQLKEALKIFKQKLNEVGVFNANLAYATRLFTEHTTTKQEKIDILQRFDNVETLKESKVLYKQIKGELETSNHKLNESVVNKINSSPKTGSSEKLVESKTYENPQITRMKQMMGIIK